MFIVQRWVKLLIKRGIKALLLSIILIIAMVAFSIFTDSFFHNQTLKTAIDGCEKNGGIPVVEKDYFAIHYYFSCEKK